MLRKDEIKVKASGKKITAFISYSHQDMKYKEKLLNHFSSINKAYDIDIWHDGCINAGGDINREVLKNLDSANLILLLLSPSYISSDFCYNIEMKRAFERYKNGECLIVPILLKHTALTKNMPFYSLKTLPTDRKPLTSFKPQDKGCVDVTGSLMDLIEDFINQGNFVSYRSGKHKKRTIKGQTNIYVPLCRNGKLVNHKVGQELLSAIMEYHISLIDFSDAIHSAVIVHVRKYAEKKRSGTSFNMKQRKRLFRSFLLDICLETYGKLFPLGGARVHFRGLYSDFYQCIMAYDEKDRPSLINVEWNNEMTPMSLNSMIAQSAKLDVPLIKSMNKDFHEKGTHDDIWVDYMSCALKNLDTSINPRMSFGISIHKNYASTYKNVLIALSVLRIDKIIEKTLHSYINLCKEIDSNYNLAKIIKSLCSTHN